MLLAYRHRNDGALSADIPMPNIIPGTQQAANYIRGSVSAVNETRDVAEVIPKTF